MKEMWSNCMYSVSIIVIILLQTLCLVKGDFLQKCTGMLGCDSLLKIIGVAWDLVAFEISLTA